MGLPEIRRAPRRPGHPGTSGMHTLCHKEAYPISRSVERHRSEPSLSKPSATREYTPLPFPSILTSYVLATQWRRGLLCSLGAIAASLPKPSFVFAHDRRRRASSAHSYPLPHVDRHLSDSAALDRLLPCPYPHVGVGFRHTQIAGCVRASNRLRYCLRASVQRYVKLRLEARALFRPTGSIVDRDPLGVTCIAVAKAVEPGLSCVAVALAVSVHLAGRAAPHAVVRRNAGATRNPRATGARQDVLVREPPVAVERYGGDAGT